ncbi:hypothetical protein N7449_005283 [Penicillium cf. viridicatum]|uniref:Uncharacterized protein n=1 Tax=Penicillium cf. viridicatum TaxID=2972119 RepID=A0A9W9MKU7_9EURO|nr:hypothetical protein N7449_005283 [Penicillium cf. viridicatum]
MHLGVVSSVPLEVDTGHKLNHLSEIQPSQTSEESADAFTPLSMEYPSDKFHEVVRGPLNYLLSAPGKDFRRQLISAFNQSLQVPADKLDVINHIVELLHTASLLIDDIQDDSELRRGLPVAHKVYGIPQTINSANYAYFLAQQELIHLKPDAFHVFTEELLNLHLGQGKDLYWRDCLICPSEEEYLTMVSQKTGGLFRLALKLMQLESDSSLDLLPLADKLGLIFQIRDDYQNLQSKSYTDNKGFCEDLSEGKFSFLIIHSIRSNPNDPQLLNILRQRSTEYSLKCHAVRYMESTGSFLYCRKKLACLVQEARDMIEGRMVDGQGDGIQKLLNYLDLSEE